MSRLPISHLAEAKGWPLEIGRLDLLEPAATKRRASSSRSDNASAGSATLNGFPEAKILIR